MTRLIRSALVGLLSAAVASAPVTAAAISRSTSKSRAEGQPAPMPSKTRPGPSSSSEPEDKTEQPVVVDADRMESFQKEGIVVFSGNVVARRNNSTHYADRMEVYLDEPGERVLRTISTGNVRVVTRDCRIGTAQRGEYYDREERLVLIGDARVWQDDNVVTGERMTIYLAEERSIVEGGEKKRVKAVFYPSSFRARKSATGATPCPE